MVEYVDIVPTFIDIAGGKPQTKLDGKSFKNVETASPLFKQWMKLGENDSHAKEMTYKYQHRPAVELYDVKNDPYCMNNLADNPDYASVIARLDKELRKWIKDCGDEGQATEMRAFEHMPGKMKKNK